MTAQPTERAHDLCVGLDQRPSRLRSREQRREEWFDFLVAQPNQLLKNRRGRRFAERPLQDSDRFGRAHVDQRARRFALHVWVVIFKHGGEVTQCFLAAEHAQEIDCRSPGRRVGRQFQLFDGLAACCPESEQEIA